MTHGWRHSIGSNLICKVQIKKKLNFTFLLNFVLSFGREKNNWFQRLWIIYKIEWFFFFSISKGKNINLSFLHNFNIITHIVIQEAVWILKWKFETKARLFFKQVSLHLTTMFLNSLLVIITITIVIIVIIFKAMFNLQNHVDDH